MMLIVIGRIISDAATTVRLKNNIKPRMICMYPMKFQYMGISYITSKKAPTGFSGGIIVNRISGSFLMPDITKVSARPILAVQ